MLRTEQSAAAHKSYWEWHLREEHTVKLKNIIGSGRPWCRIIWNGHGQDTEGPREHECEHGQVELHEGWRNSMN